MSVLYHLAAQRETLVILLQETHYTSAQRLVLPTLIASMLTGVMIPIVQMGNDWLAGQIPTILSYSITQRLPPTSTLAAGIKVQPGSCIRQYRFGQSFARQTNLRKVSKVSTSILAYHSAQVCSSCTKQACKATELSQPKWSHYITLTNKLSRHRI